MCNAWNHHADCDCGWGGGNNKNYFIFSKRKNKYLSDEINIKNSATKNCLCPICGQGVFFYKSDFGGSVFFDSLGHPWPRHQCMHEFENKSELRSDEGFNKAYVHNVSSTFLNDVYEIKLETSDYKKTLYFKYSLDLNIEDISVKIFENNKCCKLSILTFDKFKKEWFVHIISSYENLNNIDSGMEVIKIKFNIANGGDDISDLEFKEKNDILYKIASNISPYQMLKIYDIYKRYCKEENSLEYLKNIKSLKEFKKILIYNTIINFFDTYKNGRREVLFDLVDIIFGECFNDRKKISWDMKMLIKSIDDKKKIEIISLIDLINYFLERRRRFMASHYTQVPGF